MANRQVPKLFEVLFYAQAILGADEVEVPAQDSFRVKA
jgi:hypothetical protein